MVNPPDLMSFILKSQVKDGADLAELFFARHFFSNSRYASSALIYSWLDQRQEVSSYSFSVKISAKRFCGKVHGNIGSLFDSMGIDKVYVLNLSRRTDRKLRMAAELSRSGIFPNFVTAVDSEFSLDADSFFSEHIANIGLVSKWDVHLHENHRNAIAKVLKKGGVAYKLSQKSIFEDALKNNFQKIAIFDDDVFFSLCAFKTFDKFISNVGDDWKIVALGASDEIIFRKRLGTDAISIMESVGYYKPDPGKTCGSFAMLYDRSVFSEILEATQHPSGTFDNTALGAMYAKYPNDCYVLFPNIVTPSVADSDIRHSRDQLEHSKRMFWDLSGYKRWLSPIEAYVVCEDNCKSLDHDFEFLTEDVLAFRFVSMAEAEHLQMPDDLIVHLSAEEFCQENKICDLMCEKLATTPSTSDVRRFFLYIN